MIPPPIEAGLSEQLFPGCSWAFGRGEAHATGHAGSFTYEPDSRAVDSETLWDLASLTKILSTTAVAMVLAQSEELEIDKSVSFYLPRFRHSGVTIRELLLHRSGLPPYFNYQEVAKTPKEAEDTLFLLERSDKTPPETAYSCLGFMILQRVLEHIGQSSLDVMASNLVFQPLGMGKTLYRPSLESQLLCPPTQVIPQWRRELEDERGVPRVDQVHIQGAVHDPAAFMMGGVSGNAGLFASLDDVLKFVKELAVGGDKVFNPETVRTWSARQDATSTRALGFDTKSPEGSSAGSKMSAKTFGHTGYTGTSFWVDPASQSFVILLSNRVHPDDRSQIHEFRRNFADWTIHQSHHSPAQR